MKNTIKTGLLALAIATSFAACKGKDSSESAKTDSTATTTVIDSTKKDTTAAADSSKKDTTTTVKTETKTSTTETKKN